MPRSQITQVRARTTIAARSQLTQVRARTASAAGQRSQITQVRARTAGAFRSQLTQLRARTSSNTGPTAVLTHTAPLVGGLPTVGPTESFTISLATSFGGTFTGYVFSQLSGPTAVVTGSGSSRTITAPAAKPLVAGFPNDVALSMVFQGTVQVSGGAVTDADTITIVLYPHLTWAADGSPLFWSLGPFGAVAPAPFPDSGVFPDTGRTPRL